MDETIKKAVKIGVSRGQGSPPFEWSVLILSQALDDSERILELDQREHIRLQVLELAKEPSPTQSQTIDVRPIQDFFELRDKGGPLGKKNVRVFFTVDHFNKSIAILGTILKQNDGRTRQSDLIRMKHRLRRYKTIKTKY